MPSRPRYRAGGALCRLATALCVTWLSACATSAPPISCPSIPPLNVPTSSLPPGEITERLWRALLPSQPMPSESTRP